MHWENRHTDCNGLWSSQLGGGGCRLLISGLPLIFTLTSFCPYNGSGIIKFWFMFAFEVARIPEPPHPAPPTHTPDALHDVAPSSQFNGNRDSICAPTIFGFAKIQERQGFHVLSFSQFLSICLSAVCLSVFLSICLSVFLSVCLCISVSVFIDKQGGAGSTGT